MELARILGFAGLFFIVWVGGDKEVRSLEENVFIFYGKIVYFFGFVGS